MKQLMKFFLLPLKRVPAGKGWIPTVFFLLFAFSSKATHIVGGDITVKWVSGNNFEVTLTFYKNCASGAIAYDNTITLGVYDQTTNAMQQSFTMDLNTPINLILGDTCYSPPNLCVQKGVYRTTITIPDNPNGYYISWLRCCRPGSPPVDNIANPGSSGYVFYTKIPNPAMHNSSPVFFKYPDAYMCVNYPNKDDFSATDADGDSLVYDLTVPLDCDPTTSCSFNAVPSVPTPGTYGTIPWQPPYSPTNIMGDPAMAVNPQTGMVTTTPPSQGLFVFCVRVQEYRAGIKIGEIRRDVQYAVLPCVIPTVSVGGPNPICLGQSTILTAAGGQNYIWNTGATTISITVAPTATGTYTFSATTTVNSVCHISADTSITVKPLPVIEASPDNNTICPGNTISLSATGAGTGAYSWIPSATLTNPNSSNPVTQPAGTGTYTYIVTGTDANGCKNKDTVLVNVGIEPQALFSASNTLSCDGVHVQFTDSSKNAASWYWIFGDGTTSTEQSPTHLFSFDNSLYSVTLVVANPPCQDSLEKTIPTSSFITIAPANVFTPNGDGKNDCFHPVLTGSNSDNLIQCIHLEIFDRWGRKMFESDGTKTCWDGTNRNNRQVANGTYYYMAELGETRIKGFVEVIR